jgi:hypothetical protein
MTPWLRYGLLPTATLVLGLALGRLLVPESTVTAGSIPGSDAAAAPDLNDPAVARALSDEELRISCLPLMRQAASTLQEAETKVEALNVKVRAKETEVTRLEVEMSGGNVSTTELEARLELARAELEQLHAALKEALTAREVIAATLTETQDALAATQAALTDQRQQTRVAREDAAQQRWNVFVSDAQLTLCREGVRERVEGCRATIANAMLPMQRRYKECIRSGQATPELKGGASPEELPEYAEFLDQSQTWTRGWYVLFCDPDLPEARGGAARPLSDPTFFRGQARPGGHSEAPGVMAPKTTEP